MTPEAPGHSYGMATRSACRLHVDSGITKIKHVLRRNAQFLGDFQNPGGVWFFRNPLTLSENTLEIPIGQKVTGSGQREFMGFVAEDGELHPSLD